MRIGQDKGRLDSQNHSETFQEASQEGILDVNWNPHHPEDGATVFFLNCKCRITTHQRQQQLFLNNLLGKIDNGIYLDPNSPCWASLAFSKVSGIDGIMDKMFMPPHPQFMLKP